MLEITEDGSHGQIAQGALHGAVNMGDQVLPSLLHAQFSGLELE